MPRKLRTLLFSTLYPSAARPVHGIFVETRLRELLKTGEVEARVVAPVPWFPSTSPRFGDRAAMARTPRRELRHGIEVLHPRYPLIPKLGMTLAPFFLAAAARPALKRLIEEGFDFDLIDAHYYYPDGVAAALLARYFRRPVVITARGSDINLIGRFPLPRCMIAWAGRQAAASVGVSGALVDAMKALGVPQGRLHKVRNGVDLQRFHPLGKVQSRTQLRLQGAPVLLSVGNLVELKGHDICIDALAILRAEHPQAHLLIIGSGPEHQRLQQYAEQRQLADGVSFVGQVPNESLAAWYSAADVLLLASSREGWPNVLLEALACGTPVVASAVGGVPEVLAGEASSRLAAARSGEAFAHGIREVLGLRPAGAEAMGSTSALAHASRFGWDATSQQQLNIFRKLMAEEATHA